MAHFLPSKELLIPPHLGDLTPFQYLEHLVSIRDKYNALATVHIVDFFTKNYWELIDVEWQKALMQEDQRDDEFIDTLMDLASHYECKVCEYLRTTDPINTRPNQPMPALLASLATESKGLCTGDEDLPVTVV